jgi:hypothetical protein
LSENEHVLSYNFNSISMKKFTFIAVLSIVYLGTFAQTPSTGSSQPQSSSSSTGFQFKLPSVFLGAGVLYFNGDIGKGAGVTPYSTVRTGAILGVEERFLPYLGVSLSALYGKLAASERSLDTTRNLNFESKIIQGDLLVSFHLAGSVFKSDYPVDPFIYAGASFLSFSPYADLKDANGNPYYYWTDGTVRNQPETSENIISAKIVNRDYKYETALDSGKYSKHTFSIPLGIGIKLRITDQIFVNLQTTYYLTFSPNIDNYKLSGKNNKYIFSFFTIEYNFGKPKEDANEAVKYKNVDFSALIKDTIKAAPKQVKEVVLSDSAIAAQHAKDTISEDRSAEFNANPSEATLTAQDKAIQTKASNVNAPVHSVPAKFASADKNGDGYISSQEITTAIDEFFDGSSPMTIADINALIDYFFDQ